MMTLSNQERIAAAKQAMEKGDFDQARQWLAHVTHPKKAEWLLTIERKEKAHLLAVLQAKRQRRQRLNLFLYPALALALIAVTVVAVLAIQDGQRRTEAEAVRNAAISNLESGLFAFCEVYINTDGFWTDCHRFAEDAVSDEQVLNEALACDARYNNVQQIDQWAECLVSAGVFG